MKNFKIVLSFLLILALMMLPLTGCSDKTDPGNTAGGDTDTPEDSGSSNDTDTPDEPDDTDDTDDTDGGEGAETIAFSYSDNLDENGYWEGVQALDYVEMFTYKGIVIPGSVHTVEESAIQGQIDELLTQYASSVPVTDRVVADGDTVNIDFTGSIDGVEFENGSTEGQGAEVTIGVTSFIDDFLEQLIGHMPGDTFDVEVTFPEVYENSPELAGQDAVFVTTINYIVEEVAAELSDAFVQENFTDSYGWTSVEEMRSVIAADLQRAAIEAHLQTYLAEAGKVSAVPEPIMEYQVNSLVSYYESYAAMFGMDIDAFLSAYVGVDSIDTLCESYYEENLKFAKYYLVLQAIAEDMHLIPSDTDVAVYFLENVSSEGYESYEAEYGMPYLKQFVLCDIVINDIIDNVILE